MPLPILHLHHIAISVRDTDASVNFYRDVLGFRPIERPNFDFRGAWLLGYGIQIHIMKAQSPEAQAASASTRAPIIWRLP
jgi:glyoxylase I family protein